MATYFLHPGRIQTLDIIIHNGLGLLLLMLTLLKLAMIREPSALQGYNELNKLSWNLSKEYPFKNKQDDLVIFLATTSTISMLFVAFGFIFGTVATEFDFFYFFMEQLLPKPMYRDRVTILVSIACRILLISVPGFEICRSIAFLTISILITFDSLIDITQKLNMLVTSVKTHNDIYIRLSIMSKLCQNSLHTLTWIVLSCTFWGIVFLVWIIVKGHGRLPNILMLRLRGELMVVVVFFAILIPEITNIIVGVFEAASAHQNGAERNTLRRRVDRRKLTCYGLILYTQLRLSMVLFI
ncbi:unnamed protein product [Orchesella dallaii]|uniref:Uncharacterized protein n=1 Tax=Orchesella dallaii TaxID=48710 RepID=A0ABP1S7N0_9HEXA